MTRVMVVEDDASVLRLLSSLLADEGYQPVATRTGEEALKVFAGAGADLVLLDLGLPGLSGMETFQRLRRKSDVPVIMVTGKASEIDRIVGLEMGADDYVTKPFSPRELTARVRAVLRRRRDDIDEEEIMICGPVRMDVAGHVVTVRDAPVKLPLKEFQLLEVLLRNAGLVVTRTRLLEAVWGLEYVGLDTKTIDVHVKRLRAKIEPVPRKPRHIITVRGLGYRFQEGAGPSRHSGGHPRGSQG